MLTLTLTLTLNGSRNFFPFLSSAFSFVLYVIVYLWCRDEVGAWKWKLLGTSGWAQGGGGYFTWTAVVSTHVFLSVYSIASCLKFKLCDCISSWYVHCLFLKIWMVHVRKDFDLIWSSSQTHTTLDVGTASRILNLFCLFFRGKHKLSVIWLKIKKKSGHVDVKH